jgi:cytoskeletal protein CcmA (bactofilin family)
VFKKRSNHKGCVETVFGETTEFKGILNFEGSLRIEGKFEGEINTDGELIIGEDAEIKANINAGSVFIAGKVQGNIKTTSKVELQSNGQLIGDITAPTVSIAEGSLFQGNCYIEQKPSLMLTDFSKEGEGEELDFRRVAKLK